MSEDKAACEVADCRSSATHRVGNRRGEGLRVCPAHLPGLRAALVGPVVTRLVITESLAT